MKHDYKSAGVDVHAGYEAVKLMKEHVESTLSKNVLGSIGGFGGMFSLKEFKNMEEPILVSGTDGVGTKLKLAFIMDKHDTIGIDCVAMCVNDVLCVGAKPLFFLDYIACSKNIPNKIATIVKGVADGCKQSECSLVGGETAEMPGFYAEGEYDIAGFTVGIVDKEKMIDGSKINAGDVLIGLPSSGLHSNGFSLVRSVIRPTAENLQVYIESLDEKLGNALLMPTKIYTKIIFKLLENVEIKGVANITGGGFIENIPRMFDKPLCAKINEGTWPILPVFQFLKQQGQLDKMDMYNTFNMGIGMVIAVSRENADTVLKILADMNETGYIIGEVTEGEGVNICLE